MTNRTICVPNQSESPGSLTEGHPCSGAPEFPRCPLLHLPVLPVAGRQERVARRSYGEAMSGMRREPDIVRKGGEGRFMTQSGPSARVLSGAWAMSQASRKLGENHRPHPPRHPTPRKVLSCFIEFRVSLSGCGLNPSTRNASAASSETIVENLSCYAATTDAPCGSPAVVSRSISVRVTSGSR